jgi:hypothetical protein
MLGVDLDPGWPAVLSFGDANLRYFPVTGNTMQRVRMNVPAGTPIYVRALDPNLAHGRLTVTAW